MDNKAVILACIFIFTVVYHLGEAQVTAKKKIFVEISCKEVNWTEHSRKSCDVINMTVDSLDSAELKLTNLTFARKIRKFLDPLGLDETCFKDGFQNVMVTEMNHSQIAVTTSSDLEKDGFIYDVACSWTRISRYDAKVENMGAGGCDLKPLGVEDDCRSQELLMFIQMEVILQKINESEFNVISKSITRWSRESQQSECIVPANGSHIPSDYNETQFQIHLSEKDCNDSNIFPPPSRCLDFIWNNYAWQKCSKSSFGDHVLHLDGRFDRWVLGDLRRLCGEDLGKMNACMKDDNALCRSPSLENFNFYTKLNKSYADICANRADFSEGHRCFQSIMSDERMEATYFDEVQKCSLVQSKDVCLDYSKYVLCLAFSQYKTYDNCTSFGATYRYKRIIEDRNNAAGNCTSTEIDPCSLKDPTYNKICSSGAHAEISFVVVIMLFCLGNWFNLSGPI